MLRGFLHSAPEPAVTARVTRCESGTVDTSGGAMARQTPLFGPYGVCGLPPEGEEVLLVPLEGGAACAGALCIPRGLQPGEVALCSAGGARIVLKNSGEIELNGLVVKQDGTLRERGQSGQ